MLSRHANVATDLRGNVIKFATITVRAYNDAVVPIYADRAGTAQIPGAVITADQYGNWGFFGVPGYYKATIAKPGYLTVTYTDILLPQVDETFNAKYFGIVDNVDVSAGIMNWAGELEALGGGQILLPPLYAATIKDVVTHPSVSVAGIGRGASRLRMADGCSWGWKVLARARGSLESDGWFPFFEHFTIDGRRAAQSGNTVHALLFENIEADPNYGTYAEKGYCGGRVVDVEITSAAGVGIYAMSGRKRMYLQNTRCINGGSKGALIAANDPVVGERCGFGGNDEHQLMFSACSGALVSGVNAWGGGAKRSNSCLSLHMQNVNGGLIENSVFNDTVSINQTTSDYRGISVVGNHFKPLEDYFVSDGVPVGSADPSCNAYLRVRGGKNVVVVGNNYTRTVDGTRFAYLETWTDDAQGGTHIVTSSNPNVKPWATTDPVPILIDGSSNVEYTFTDVYAGYTRASARFLAGLAHNGAVQDGYDVVLGGQNPALFTNRVHLQRGLAILPSSGQEFVSMDVGDGTKVIASNRARVTFYSNNKYVTAYQVTLPDTPDPGHELELVFESGVQALTLVMGNTAHNIFGGSITRVPPGTLLRLTFKPGTAPAGQWWVVSSAKSDSRPKGTQFVAMVNGGSKVMEQANRHLHLTRTSVCTNYTVQFPPDPEEDEERAVTFHNGVTAFTLAPNAGQSLHTTDTWPTTIPAGGYTIEAQFSGGVWYLTRAG
jgi:hypothetical protein